MSDKNEWPYVCEAKAHRGRAIPALDVYTEPRSNIKYHLCGPCSKSMGALLKSRGWKFRTLRQTIPISYTRKVGE